MPRTYGETVEIRVRNIAAMLGVPEFVYHQPFVRKGKAVREVGDGLILCGKGGAILQVKSRSLREGRRDTDAEAERWVLKHVARAVRQGRGSKRTILSHQQNGSPLGCIPVRAIILSEPERESFRVDLVHDCSHWPIIVVVDHPLNPHVTLPTHEDAFCISLTDWHELNRHLRSVHEVLGYVDLVLERGADVAVPLSHEFDRFSSLVAFEGSSVRMSPRARPWTTFAAVEDPVAISEYRTLLERTWGPNDDLPEFPSDDYREMLDFLDDAPAVAQAFIGRWLAANRSQLRSLRRRVSGSVLVVDRPLVLLMDYQVNKPDKRAWLAELWALTAARAIEYRRQTQAYRNALGVGIRVLDGFTDEYSYILMRPEIEVPDDLVRETEWYFGVANFSTSRVERLKVARNERCPCRSGKKFKHCHGATGLTN